MSDVEIPNRPEAINATWMASVLGRGLGEDVPVRSVGVELIGGGFLGTVARVSIDSFHPGAPTSLVAKFAHPDAATRAEVWDADIYQREARFYQELRPHIPLNTPRPWFAHTDRDADRHLLVLDDLSGATLYDQVTGCPPARAIDIVRDLAVLHREFWGVEDGIAKRLARAVDDEAWFELTAGAIPAMLARDDLTLELRWLTEGYADIGPRAIQQLDGRRTVVHADARVENVFFDGEGARIWIDWDGIQLGGGGADLAYFMSQSLTVADRRAHEAELIQTYVDTIGRADYSIDDSWTDYRTGIIAGWAVGLAVVGVYGPQDVAADRLVEEGIRRIGAAVADHDALEAIL